MTIATQAGSAPARSARETILIASLATFSFTTDAYGSLFYTITGLQGLHVFV